MTSSTYIKKEITEILVVVIFMGVLIGIGSLFFGFGLGGFERQEVLTKNNFYLSYGFYFIITWVACKLLGIMIFGEKNSPYDGVPGAADPEQTPLGFFTILKSKFLLLYFSLIVFIFLGWLAVTNQTFFTSIPEYEQQFTITADIFFSIYPASPIETFGAFALISIVGLLLGQLFVNNKIKTKAGFFFAFVPSAVLVSTIYGVINHWLRYGFNDAAIQNVAFFWAFGGAITAISGSIIPFLVMHDVNNFFVKLKELFTNDIINITTIFLEIFLIVGFIITFIYIKKRQGKNSKLVSPT